MRTGQRRVYRKVDTVWVQMYDTVPSAGKLKKLARCRMVDNILASANRVPRVLLAHAKNTTRILQGPIRLLVSFF